MENWGVCGMKCLHLSDCLLLKTSLFGSPGQSPFVATLLPCTQLAAAAPRVANLSAVCHTTQHTR